MRHRTPFVTVLLTSALAVALPAPADGQLGRLRNAAKRAVESEAESMVDRLVRDAIRCAVGDQACVDNAEEDGEEVIFVDDDGEIIVDEEGNPITDPERARATVPPGDQPGEGLWANYDFVPGDQILFYDDFSGDRVGDFPRRLEFIEGNWEIVEGGEKRYLRATSAGLAKIPLPETLPDRFTVEFAVNTTHGNSSMWLTTGPAFHGRDRSYQGSAATVRSTEAGLQSVGDVGPVSMTLYEQEFLASFRDDHMPKSFRFMADGEYVKIYMNEHRVANVPNAVFPRTDALYIAVTSVSPGSPGLIGPIRIASGGRDLYDRLEADGRVATQGILFAVDSDRIRPESTPTLDEIGSMLQDHDELRIAIEGHTDSDGDEAYNLDLSDRRAAAVKAFITTKYGVDGARLEASGLGESQPLVDNATPEGKQQNRRVELVRLPADDRERSK